MRAALPSAAGPILWAALSVPSLAQDAEAPDLRSLERRTQEIKAAAAPAVVSVSVRTKASPIPRLVFPGVVIAAPGSQPERVEGAGFFLTSRGLLVTTSDLVRNADRIEVRFSDGTVRDASLLGTDAPFRMAVLRTTPPEGVAALPHAERVEASPSTIGWFLGPSGSPEPSVRTFGSGEIQVVSVRAAPEQGDEYDRYLFTPTSIQRGAAGGPLLGGDGCVLGMAVGAIVAKPETTHTRWPHATLFVRSDDIVDAIRQIALHGKVERAMLGTMMQADTNRIETTLAGGPAEAAGLADGDTVVKIGCMPVTNFPDITRALLRRRAGDPVKVTVDRNGERLTRTVTLAPLEAPPLPTTPPLPGATIEVSADPAGDAQFTLIDVGGDSLASKAGLTTGDRLLSVDGLPAWRFLQRHRARPSPTPPAKLEILRDGAKLDISLAAQ